MGCFCLFRISQWEKIAAGATFAKPAPPRALKPHLAIEGLDGKMMKRNRETRAVVHIASPTGQCSTPGPVSSLEPLHWRGGVGYWLLDVTPHCQEGAWPLLFSINLTKQDLGVRISFLPPPEYLGVFKTLCGCHGSDLEQPGVVRYKLMVMGFVAVEGDTSERKAKGKSGAAGGGRSESLWKEGFVDCRAL